MSYSAIANSEIDASSPLTETLMTKIRDNIEGHNHSEATTTKVSAQLGAWTARSFDTVYLAATDLLITAYAEHSTLGSNLDGLTDASNPPTTRRVFDEGLSAVIISIVFPVKKGDYWKVTKVNGTTSNGLYEIAIGS